MTRNTLIYIFYCSICLLITSSCGSRRASQATLYNPAQVEQLSKKLKISLSNTNKEDDINMSLYAEVSLWLGVPYRYAGNTKNGVDCSGFSYQVYHKVYKIQIPRSTAQLDKMKKKKIAKSKLQTSDLIFFATGKKKNTINHVGIYLKDGMFIHASTSRGVIVSHIDENYYKKAWKYAARVR